MHAHARCLSVMLDNSPVDGIFYRDYIYIVFTCVAVVVGLYRTFVTNKLQKRVGFSRPVP
jgi:hypothetical protein